MFALLRIMVSLGIVFALVWLGLAYLPGETTSELGGKAATVAMKGCRGAQAFYDAFRRQWEGEKSSPAPAPQKR